MSSQQPLILIVDDEPSVIGIVEIILTRAGYRVLTSPHPKLALRHAEQADTRVDLLITDIAMPFLDGPQLAALFRERSPHTRVLYMTGHPTRAALERGLSESDDILRKPFHPRTLLQRVELALARAASAGA